MKQLSLALTDEEIELLFNAGECVDDKNSLDIKKFCDKVAEALKVKPLPNFLAQPKTKGVGSKL